MPPYRPDRRLPLLPWAVMCCRCKRIMGTDGKPVDTTTGLVALAGCASFATHEAADAMAFQWGWQVKDALGPNHRCQECRGQHGGRRGAYVDLRQ